MPIVVSGVNKMEDAEFASQNRTSIPLALGERLYSRAEFLPMLNAGVTVVQPDTSHAGGISELPRLRLIEAPLSGAISELASSAWLTLLQLPSANAGRGVALTFEQFKYGWANNLPDDEARELFETFHVPAAGAPLAPG